MIVFVAGGDQPYNADVITMNRVVDAGGQALRTGNIAMNYCSELNCMCTSSNAKPWRIGSEIHYALCPEWGGVKANV